VEAVSDFKSQAVLDSPSIQKLFKPTDRPPSEKRRHPVLAAWPSLSGATRQSVDYSGSF
jgi:hypothetical protein